MSSRRWSKFWWQDWQRDPALRMCSPAARGIWMDMLCIMADADPVGHLCVNGRQPTNKQLGSIFGISEKEASLLIRELEDNGVFSRTEAGAIFSRRMVRDHEASERGREAIAKRWNNNDDGGSDPNTQSDRSTNTDQHSHPNADIHRDPNRGAYSLEAEAEAEAEAERGSLRSPRAREKRGKNFDRPRRESHIERLKRQLGLDDDPGLNCINGELKEPVQ